MLKKIKSKLKSKSGLTLTELLITVILIAFFSSACLLGISTALSTRTSMIKAADSDILCSTLTQYISNELRLSLNGDNSEPGKFRYYGGSTNANESTGVSQLWVEGGVLMHSIGGSSGYSVFNESAYSGFTLVDGKLVFTIDGDKNTITCSFEIKDDSGNERMTEFTVTPLTPIASSPIS